MSKTYRIGVIPGDCTGPEVVAEGLRVLNAVSEEVGFRCDLHSYDFGGERYLKTGEILPDSAIEEFRGMDALYLGAIGHPKVKPGVIDQIVLKLRFALDQYINLRPCKLLPGVESPLRSKGPADIDFVIVRENTEGLYAGAGGVLKKGTPDEVAIQESIMGGSAPKYTGMKVINPLAAILACKMMLDHLGEREAARLIENAVIKVLTCHLKSLEAGKMGYTTSEVGIL